MVAALENRTLLATLKEVFGYNQFRGNQVEIIQNILQGKNTFVIMPTGAGKSLCYQLPAIVSQGTAIVISPLIALMKNQVDQLNAFGINAHFLNSTLSKADLNQVKKDVLSGETKLLYVAPESLTKDANVAFLKQATLSFVAVDEAHCISEWGHDFRPEYRRIKSIIEQLGNLPIIALTATATPKVQSDVQKNLHMEEANLFTSSFYRANLFYEVKPKVESKKQLIKFVQRFKGKSGIVYCLSRKKVEEIAELLKVNNISTLPYHAGMEASVRVHNQDAFLNEDVDVIVATIAFGMGIDKPDVRFVVHYDTPKSLEGYYQETGRAGRDGLKSSCMMFYSPKDIQKLEKFSKDKPVTERDNARLLLKEMTYYAKSSVCRPRQLLHYFGEYAQQDCGTCDNCTRKRVKFNGKEHVSYALDAVKQTEERFDIEHVAHILAGEMTEYIESYSHHKLHVFAKGKSHGISYWESVVRQAMIHKLLKKDAEDIRIIKLTQEGKAFLKSPVDITLTEDHDFSEAGAENEEDTPVAPPNTEAFDEGLFEQLCALRKKVAKKKGFPPYVIFQEPSLEEMATSYPRSEDELAQINGVGMGKVKKFGKPFIDLIKNYVEENDITTVSDVVVKSSVNRSKTKIFIIQQIDRKIDLEDIAESKNISYEDVITEIENICYSGTKLNLEYYLDQLIDPLRQEEIFDYFMQAESDSIEDALDDLGDEDFSEDEIRLMRIKFMSDIAL